MLWSSLSSFHFVHNYKKLGKRKSCLTERPSFGVLSETMTVKLVLDVYACTKRSASKLKLLRKKYELKICLNENDCFSTNFL